MFCGHSYRRFSVQVESSEYSSNIVITFYNFKATRITRVRELFIWTLTITFIGFLQNCNQNSHSDKFFQRKPVAIHWDNAQNQEAQSLWLYRWLSGLTKDIVLRRRRLNKFLGLIYKLCECSAKYMNKSLHKIWRHNAKTETVRID